MLASFSSQYCISMIGGYSKRCSCNIKFTTTIVIFTLVQDTSGYPALLTFFNFVLWTLNTSTLPEWIWIHSWMIHKVFPVFNFLFVIFRCLYITLVILRPNTYLYPCYVPSMLDPSICSSISTKFLWCSSIFICWFLKFPSRFRQLYLHSSVCFLCPLYSSFSNMVSSVVSI